MRIAGSGIPAATVASCNRDILSGQSPIHCQRKITPHLNPVLVPIRPRSKVKAHSTGGEVDNIRLRCWFFRYAWMTGRAFSIIATRCVSGTSTARYRSE